MVRNETIYEVSGGTEGEFVDGRSAEGTGEVGAAPVAEGEEGQK